MINEYFMTFQLFQKKLYASSEDIFGKVKKKFFKIDKNFRKYKEP